VPRTGSWLATALTLLSACVGDPPRVSSVAPPFDPGVPPPELSEGAQNFLAFCSGCHGNAGAGFENGPPLLHARYLPDVFPDSNVRRAILSGAPARHWSFDDMPPVRVLPPDRIPGVIGYLRWVQGRWTAQLAS
jgi:hypothetical protein